MALARFGATPAGGVNRQALSDEDAEARRALCRWAGAAGLEPSVDPIGNLFLRLPGAEPEAEPVLSGSHLDSQPTGGKFDGTYGVLAALEAAEALRALGLRPRRAIDVVAWTNEEGSRFAPGMMGSAAFAGRRSLDEILPVRDADGVSVEEALRRLGERESGLPRRALGAPLAAYVEAHIEQGPILEAQGVPTGVVTGIQGKRTFLVTVRGEEAHAGTTPRRERRDALSAAVAMIAALEQATYGAHDDVMFTVGRLLVRPNAPSVIPAEVAFSVDLRHTDAGVLAALGDAISSICEGSRGPCDVSVQELVRDPPLEFPRAMRDLIRASAATIGVPTMEIYSAAGHDARYLHHVCPAGMIFVPCHKGISHNEAESATPQDLAAGAALLTAVLLALADA